MLGLPSCKKVSEQSSLQLDDDLSLMQRVGLKIHLAMCQHCRRYVQQMKLTEQSVRYWLKRKSMPDAVKQRLLKEYEAAAHQHKNDH